MLFIVFHIFTDLVVQHLKLQSTEDSAGSEKLVTEMGELVPKVKEIAVTTKKGSSQAAAAES